MRAVPHVAVSGVRLLDGRLHRDPLRFHVGDEILAALELPFPPRRDDLQVRREGGIGELEADLVVPLTRAAMGEGLRTDPLGERHLMRRHHRPRHRRAQQIGARVHGTGAQRGKDEIADELLAQVLDHAARGAGALGLLDEPVELAGPLPDVRRETDNPGAVPLAEPGNDRRGVESARVGEHHQPPHVRSLQVYAVRCIKIQKPGGLSTALTPGGRPPP